MNRLVCLSVFSVFLFHLFSLGMQLQQPTEDSDLLFASDEFRLQLKNDVGVRDSYNFLCDIVGRQKEIAQKKLGKIIANYGPLWIRISYRAARLAWNVDELMIDEWLNRKEQVGDMLVPLEEKRRFSIWSILRPELKKIKANEKKGLAKGVGKYATARLFYNMQTNDKEILKGAKELVEQAWEEKEGKTRLERSCKIFSRKLLDKAVPWMITFFTKNEDKFKNFFEEIACIALEKEIAGQEGSGCEDV